MNDVRQVYIDKGHSLLNRHYYESVQADFAEVKKEYPFCFLTIPPTVEPQEAKIYVVAANSQLITACHAVKEDFLGDYSKELWLSIPADYKDKGCKVYGGPWIDINRIPEAYRHFYMAKGSDKNHGYELCVGVPDSFRSLKNVILENIRTAEHLLIAYENYLCRNTDTIVVEGYSHGDKGIREYDKNRKKYKST
ncbi:hypothetical protein [Butyrivibrio sp. INlla14]|uniref:hypothetical protein n=1 Tax=Butyrivibrio sp. INlla14 TaxID=1520808 RepID=UPI0008761B75|nr:hypothetical protein [Butyrivibrio sp. INlla14]SCY74185.1 hypothetical protein SAMN02910371_03681 [Butyrivibrio sp. INlla14]